MAVLLLSRLRNVMSPPNAMELSSGTLDVVTSIELRRPCLRASRVTVYRIVWLALGTLLRPMTLMPVLQDCVVLEMWLVRQRMMMVSALGLRRLIDATMCRRKAPFVNLRRIPGPDECTCAFLFVVRTTVVDSVTLA